MTESESSDKSLKILVCGDVEGKLSDLYNKVKSIQAKVGKFDILFCVGEFFAESEEENAEIKKFCSDPSSIPIQTYILGTNRPTRQKYFVDNSGYDLCPDKIIYLGPKGFYSTLHGLSFVYLSGVEEKPETTPTSKKFKRPNETEVKSEEEYVEFSSKDIENLINTCEKRNNGECIDILLTNQWPKYVEKLNNQQLENNQKSETFGSELISNMAMKIMPRYHFSASQNLFFERLPYRNHTMLMEKEKHMTRFLALAKVNKSNKPKYLYAFNIIPAKKINYIEIVRQSANLATDCPYNNTVNVKNSDDQPMLQYFYDAGHIQKMNQVNENNKRKIEAAQNKQQEQCWFCLGGSQVERHLIVSVGDKSYLAYAKGAINKDNLLIIPIDHVQSTNHADEKLLEDINKYKVALTKYFKARNKCVLFYERNFRTKHMQIQVYAIKADKSYLLKDAFMSMAKEQDINLNEIPEFTSLKQVLNTSRPFFHLELPNEDNDVESQEMSSSVGFRSERFLCEIRGSFPLNFGRDVMATEMLLNCPDRIEWKQCVLSQADEKEMALELRENFKKFDPFL